VLQLLLKLLGFAVLNAISVLLVMGFYGAGVWPVALLVVIVTLGLDLLYLGPWAVPLKYLAPGILLLLTFQVFVILYSGFTAFTNAGQGHLGTKQDAIAAIALSGRERVPDSPKYLLAILEGPTGLSFLVTDPDGAALVGDPATPLAPAPDAERNDAGKAVGLPGAEALTFQQILGRQDEILGMEVPIAADPADGVLRTQDGQTAFVFRSVRAYDPALDAVVDSSTGVVYRDNGRGNFAAPDGTQIDPGWRAVVGLDNFARMVREVRESEQFLGVFLWTFVFAILSVAMGFGFGTFLALVFNDPRIRGRRIYRMILILPYAFPVFLSVLIWGGLLNPEFGFINEVLLGGAKIPWLQDPWLARFSVLMVSLWLEFPYWFLIATGALQSIPRDLEEAATIDGAGRRRLFRHVRLPLLLVTVAPLLVSAFAFAFNNFNLVWLLTRGGPIALDSEIDAGATDLLITLTYKLAFDNSVQDYGLASAISATIFMIVAAISILSFRRTRRYEEVF